MPPSKNWAWSFWWVCQHCDALREYLVNECPEQAVVWGRCPRCSSLLEVRAEHREEAARRDAKADEA